MKTNTTSNSNEVSTLLGNEKPTPLQEVIRSVDVLTRDALTLHEDGRVDIRDKGMSVNEFVLFIADREATGARFKTQARWTFYAAGQLPNGSDLQAAIAEKLKDTMSSSAFAQLKSEALNLCPLAIANGFKAPLSLLKDAVADLATDDKGKLLPMKAQSKAAKELIPLLKEGGKAVTQGGIRAIRAKAKAPSANAKPTAPKSGPVAAADTAQTIGANVIRALQDACKQLDGVRLDGLQNTQAVNLLTDIGRKLGLAVTVINATDGTATMKAEVKTPAPAPAKK